MNLMQQLDKKDFFKPERNWCKSKKIIAGCSASGESADSHCSMPIKNYAVRLILK